MLIRDMRLCSLLLVPFLIAGCGGGGGGGSGGSSPVAADPTPDDPAGLRGGIVTVAITDGPMEDIDDLVLHVTHLDFGHANGDVTRLEIRGGPADIDVVALQNGITHDLVDHASLPAGEYHWLELGVDLDHSRIGLSGGGHHGMRLAVADAFRVREAFAIREDQHREFILDFDLRNAVQRHRMGGMLGSQFRLHNGLRLMGIENAGGLTGTIDTSLIDINHPGCDPDIGGNWAYLFHGNASEPDDLSSTETDGAAGPFALDRVELQNGNGEYRYHFAFLPEGSYRLAFSCSSDWDEPGDDDYPNDPDGRFHFQAFGDPVAVRAGEVTVYDVGP